MSLKSILNVQLQNIEKVLFKKLHNKYKYV